MILMFLYRFSIWQRLSNYGGHHKTRLPNDLPPDPLHSWVLAQENDELLFLSLEDDWGSSLWNFIKSKWKIEALTPKGVYTKLELALVYLIQST